MYATFLRLDITVHDGWRVAVRSAARKLTPQASRDPAHRDARHRLYRQTLGHHHEAQRLVRTWRL
ncbi:MAG: hypothetical protein ACREDY_15670 [Bradyrhizobium sp.]